MRCQVVVLSGVLLVACGTQAGRPHDLGSGPVKAAATHPGELVIDPVLRTPRSIAVPAAVAERMRAGAKPQDAGSVAGAFLREHRAAYRLERPDRELKLVSSTRDAGKTEHLGRFHLRFQQLHEGLPVFGAQTIVHLTRELLVTSAGGRTVPTPAVGTSPRISSEQALAKALGALSREARRREGEPALAGRKVEIGVFVPSLFGMGGAAPALAFRIETLGYVSFVDAAGGQVLLQYDNLQTARERETHTANGTTALPGALVYSEASFAACALGLDLLSESDRALAFDLDGDGRQDLFLYRPGTGAAAAARSNGDGTFAIHAQDAGVAGFDLRSASDRVLPFDYDGDGKQDLFLYRPGSGAAVVARSRGNGTFTAAYSQPAGGTGIAGFDLRSPGDEVLAFDYNGDKKQDLFLYRPGSGVAVVARSNGNGTFTAVPSQRAGGSGIAGFDLQSASDRVLAFDYDGDGKDDLFLYRPGSGVAVVARSNGNGTFTAVYSQRSGGGIAGFDLQSASDRVLAFDYDGNGRQDLFLYRPGTGAAFVARSNGNGTFTAVYSQKAGGSGIAGFDLQSASDRVLAFDHDGDGKDDLFLYRPGSGAALVARSNGNGTFTAVHAQGAGGAGIAGFDLKSPLDRALALDHDGDGKQGLFLYRPGAGAASIARSDAPGVFSGALRPAPAAGASDECNAHRFAGDTYDYYAVVHGRDSYDDRGARLISTVHFLRSGWCPNAAWTGSQIEYCDGLSAANDVVAHEITHAVIASTAGLAYVNESGALSESYSDVFGASVDSQDWTMGEDLARGAFRSLSDPPAFGHPDHVSDYRKNGDIHANSGIPNKAFWLLASGGTHHQVRVAPVGRAKAEHIAYRTLAQRLTPASQFVDAAEQSLQACRELVGSFGISTADCRQVALAYTAVGMLPGIGGYDLRSAGDQVLAFDYDGDKAQDLFLYRPGAGAAWVARSNGDGTFTAVHAQGTGGAGIAGFDMRSPLDRALAFDDNGDGRQDLFLYRPGSGAAVVARSNGDGTFSAVYSQRAGGTGIAGFDLQSANDQVLAFDLDGDGRQDLFLYRPGSGAAVVARSNGDGTFTTVHAQGAGGAGIAGFDMRSPLDRALAFDYNGDGWKDLLLYRPGSGLAVVARSNGNGTFTAVRDEKAGGSGIAGFDLQSESDQVLAFDYDGDGKQDLFFWRPGSGSAVVARSIGNGTFTAVYSQRAGGRGIAGFALRSASDQVLTLDYDGDGRQDLFLYRPGSGSAWVARSNGDGTFTAVYAQGPGGAGIAGFDLGSSLDRAIAFDHDGDGKVDLLFYRPGSGVAWVARSRGDGTFDGVYP